MALLRMVVGASCVLVPRPAGIFWGVPLAAGAESLHYARMFGVRDFILGAYLWKRLGDSERARARQGTDVTKGLLNKSAGMRGTDQTSSSAIPDAAETTDLEHTTVSCNLSSAVFIGMIVDIVDAISVSLLWMEGTPLSVKAEILVGGGAVLFAAIGAQYLLASRRV